MKISVGHAITRSGLAVVTIELEAECVSLSPAGARRVARQLLDWADHADAWKQLEPAARDEQWIGTMNEVTRSEASRWVAVKTESNDPPKDQAE